MSKAALIIGFFISTAAHLGVLFYDTGPGILFNTAPSPPSVTVDIVELPKTAAEEGSAEVDKPKAEETVMLEKPPEPSQIVPPPAPVESKTNLLMKEPEPASQPTSVPPVAQKQPEPPSEKPSLAIEKTRPNTSFTESQQGDFAGSSDGAERPFLRIDWGTFAEAMAVIKAAGMRLAVLDPEMNIHHELASDSQDKWIRKVLAADSSETFSNNIRIVDQVPAFGTLCTRAYLNPNERLVIVVPAKIERMIESEKIKAAMRYNLSFEQIHTFGGHFSFDKNKVIFVIDRIKARD